MVLVETHNFSSFAEYLQSLTGKARKNWRYAQKHNPVVYRQFPFEKEKIRYWMELWEQQLIRGEKRRWAFPADALEGKNILCFEVVEGETIAVQFVEETRGYLDCHPVMYDKEKYASRYLSKLMWFSLIRWSIENKVRFVDLGSAYDESWKDMIRTRADYPNSAYKWQFVPKEVKDNPDKQVDYKVEHNGISKCIRTPDCLYPAEQ